MLLGYSLQDDKNKTFFFHYCLSQNIIFLIILIDINNIIHALSSIQKNVLNV